MVETPRVQKQEQEKQQTNQTPSTPNNNNKTKNQENAQEQRSFLSVHHMKLGEKGNSGCLLPGPRIHIQAAVDLHTKRHCANGLYVDWPSYKHLLAQVLKLSCSFQL